MNCRICGIDSVETVYDKPMRSGGVGSETTGEYVVKKCDNCHVEFLHPFDDALLNRYDYESETYWDDHHGSIDVKQLQQEHDPEQLRWLSEIGVNRFRDKQVADFGCAAGQFLDLLTTVAADTIGVDPAEHFQPHLESSGHRHVKFPEALSENTVDIGVSFDTLEHIENPDAFLNEIHRTLREDGELFIGVPNQADFLTDIVPAYRSFFYHCSHLFYYDETALRTVLENAGFEVHETSYVHKYDLMNMVVWARDESPGGHELDSPFDETTEKSFRENIEREGSASHILVHASK